MKEDNKEKVNLKKMQKQQTIQLYSIKYCWLYE